MCCIGHISNKIVVRFSFITLLGPRQGMEYIRVFVVCWARLLCGTGSILLRTWIGKAEGSEGRVVGVGDVDGEAFDAGCGPEGGQVEGGVILAIEVGLQVVAAVIKVGVGIWFV